MLFKKITLLAAFVVMTSSVFGTDIDYTQSKADASAALKWVEQAGSPKTFRMDLPVLNQDTHLLITVTPETPLVFKIKEKKTNKKVHFSDKKYPLQRVFQKNVSSKNSPATFEVRLDKKDVYLEIKSDNMTSDLILASGLYENGIFNKSFVPETETLNEMRDELKEVVTDIKLTKLSSLPGFSGNNPLQSDLALWSMVGELKANQISFEGHRDEKMILEFNDQVTMQAVALEPNIQGKSELTVTFDAQSTDANCFAVLLASDGEDKETVDTFTIVPSEDMTEVKFHTHLKVGKTYTVLFMADETARDSTLTLENLEISTK